MADWQHQRLFIHSTRIVAVVVCSYGQQSDHREGCRRLSFCPSSFGAGITDDLLSISSWPWILEVSQRSANRVLGLPDCRGCQGVGAENCGLRQRELRNAIHTSTSTHTWTPLAASLIPALQNVHTPPFSRPPPTSLAPLRRSATCYKRARSLTAPIRSIVVTALPAIVHISRHSTAFGEP